MTDAAPTTLEEFVAHLHQLAFFRELTFSKNKFAPEAGRELELADGLIWLDSHLIVYQMKERLASSDSCIDKWFKNKVLKKGVKQVKDSLDYISRYPSISVTNEQGHTFSIQRTAIEKVTKAVLFLPHADDTTYFRKYHISQTADFIHLIDARDYLEVCRTLRVPADIVEYLEYREKILRKLGDESSIYREAMLVGQFVSSNHQADPTAESVHYLQALKQDEETWDISDLIASLHKNIESTNNPYDYYKILFEFAKLPRSAWREVKTRFELAFEMVRQEKFALPYRFTYPNTGCGFIFIPVPPELFNSSEFPLFRSNGVQNFTQAHKYDQRLNRCVGVAMAKDGSDYLIDWCFLDFRWERDAEMDEKMKDAPLRPIRDNEQRRYKFDN